MWASKYICICMHTCVAHAYVYGLITHVHMCMEIKIDRKSKYAKMSIFVMQVLGVQLNWQGVHDAAQWPWPQKRLQDNDTSSPRERQLVSSSCCFLRILHTVELLPWLFFHMLFSLQEITLPYFTIAMLGQTAQVLNIVH